MKTAAQQYRYERGEWNWFRYDIGGKYPNDRVMATSNTDISQYHSRGAAYDSKCSCCFLGIAHTTDEHNLEVARYTR